MLNAVRLQTVLGRGIPSFTALCAAVLLAACAGDAPPRPMHVAARVVDGEIRLDVSDIPPGREIIALALVDPRGAEIPARDREVITREQAGGGNAGPGVGIGASGGSSSGIRPYISLGYLFRADDDVQRSQRLTGRIPIPDRERYAAGYRDWRVVVRYRDQLGALREAGIPAPPPPY